MNTHHALLYTGASIAESAIPEDCKTQSTDVLHVVHESFGINEARSLQNHAHQSQVTETGRVFVIVTNRFTHEAQNALLKLFEEPPQGTRFFLVLPDTHAIIPTLRSRLQIVDASLSADVQPFTEFRSLPYADRLARIADAAKAKDDTYMHAIIAGAATIPDTASKRSVALVDQYFRSSGAAKKMLLEELALAIPVE